jgi:hypothetical protein
VLTRFKTDWAAKRQPDAIEAACDEAGYTTWRDRLHMPVETMQSFLVQIPYGNTGCIHLPHLSAPPTWAGAAWRLEGWRSTKFLALSVPSSRSRMSGS